jgi:hypothetical protein
MLSEDKQTTSDSAAIEHHFENPGSECAIGNRAISGFAVLGAPPFAGPSMGHSDVPGVDVSNPPTEHAFFRGSNPLWQKSKGILTRQHRPRWQVRPCSPGA